MGQFYRGQLRATAAALMVSALVTMTGAQAAGSGWAVLTTPSATAPNAVFGGVSCAAVSACIGVGSTLTKAGSQVALAEQWSARKWSVKPVPLPSGAGGGALAAVSCTAATACTAVGAYLDASGTQLALAEGWNGKTWAVQSTPNSTGATSAALAGVSCTAATACTAVGYAVDGTGAQANLAERWNGTTWALQTAPNPSGATSSQLNGVSCMSATACIAAGYAFSNSAQPTTLAEAWNGSTWAIQVTPNQSGAPTSQLLGVACASSTMCTAVGFSGNWNSDATRATLAEQWNGSTWSIQPTPNPSSLNINQLTGVACASVTACIAVGSSATVSSFMSPSPVTLSEKWNGSAWSVVPTPPQSGSSFSLLAGVSCASSTSCVGVGQKGSLALSELWNGTAWSSLAAVNPIGATASTLAAVSCPSATDCTAVGSAQTPSGWASLAEHWNGSAWSVKPSGNVSGSAVTQFSAVSCSAASACTAVGYSSKSSGSSAELPLAERWNGTAWVMQSPPNPDATTGTLLTGVSCPAATSCYAVGYAFTGANTSITVAEHWDGTTWSIEPTPNPSGAGSSSLGSVSCASTSACTAVGASFDSASGSESTLAEHWNGSIWAVQSTPNPSGAFSGFGSVSCPSTTLCMAVGSSFGPSGSQALSEEWSGAGWTIQPNPTPSTGALQALSAVSCGSPTMCLAVGCCGVDASGQGVPLADQWNGSAWSVTAFPGTPGAAATSIDGASCASATICIAVGAYNHRGVAPNLPQVTLAERFTG